MNHTSPRLRITGKFFFTLLTVSMLASSAVYAAQSVQEWDKKAFAHLSDTDKKEAVGVLRGVHNAFDNFEQSVDKGGEKFFDAFNTLMSIYMQLTQSITPRLDMYKSKLGLIKSVSIVPTVDDIVQLVQEMLPDNPKNEREVKRAINKGLRNKKKKQKIKELIASKRSEFTAYIDYIEKNYAEIMRECEKTERLLKKIKEGSENGQELEQILNNMSPEEQKELMQLLG